jgi:membrane-associated protease RseP (regulator of RpoE activity)
MSEQRFSIWHVLGLLALVIALCTTTLAGGVFLGYQWGRASGLAASERANAPQARPDFPELPRHFSNQPDQPYLGVQFEMITPELAEAEKLGTEAGAVIRGVAPGSPAEQAGLMVGDVVQEIDGEAVDAEHTLRALVAAHQPDDEATLSILRGTESLEIRVTLGTRPVPDIPLPQGEVFPEFGPGYRFEFRCSPEPCQFLPFPEQPSNEEPTY